MAAQPVKYKEKNLPFHNSSAAFRSSIVEYRGAEGSARSILPSSIAAMVVSLGISNFSSKGIPCSRIAVRKNILIAVVMLNPNSEKIRSA